LCHVVGSYHKRTLLDIMQISSREGHGRYSDFAHDLAYSQAFT